MNARLLAAAAAGLFALTQDSFAAEPPRPGRTKPAKPDAGTSASPDQGVYLD